MLMKRMKQMSPRLGMRSRRRRMSSWWMSRRWGVRKLEQGGVWSELCAAVQCAAVCQLCAERSWESTVTKHEVLASVASLACTACSASDELPSFHLDKIRQQGIWTFENLNKSDSKLLNIGWTFCKKKKKNTEYCVCTLKYKTRWRDCKRGPQWWCGELVN